MEFWKNVVVFEDGLNIGGEMVYGILCSYIYFEGDIDDKLEGEKTPSGI